MKSWLVLLFFSFFLIGSSCETTSKKPVPPKPCPACPKGGDKILLSLGDEGIYTQMLKDTFSNGVKISEFWVEKIEKVEKNKAKKPVTYFYRKGYDRKKNCIISRTPLDVRPIDGKDTIAYMMRMRGVTETCSGDGCSHCAFKDTGGCVCKKFSGTCNHTISKNTELLKWW